jgi:hypothetical protein
MSVMAQQPADRPSATVLRFPPRPRRTLGDKTAKTFLQWHLDHGKGDAEIVIDPATLAKFFGHRPRDAAVRTLLHLPAIDRKPTPVESATAVQWWSGHIGELRKMLAARRIPEVVICATVKSYTEAVRAEIDAIRSARHTASFWQLTAIGAVAGSQIAAAATERDEAKNG